MGCGNMLIFCFLQKERLGKRLGFWLGKGWGGGTAW